ncbi:MAG: tripartite tricarboxylate transporter substrate binding protein [Rhizobiales bacterium]|nr:tripartite tricarboxylate transporter substrate binding protein [Hyphomicrobiales bacterium]
MPFQESRRPDSPAPVRRGCAMHKLGGFLFALHNKWTGLPGARAVGLCAAGIPTEQSMNKMTRRQALNAGLATFAASFAPLSTAFGQTKYPNQPIRLIVPRPAGGVVDVVGRVWSNQAGASLEGTIVVENIGGGGGTIGTAQAARATADGYTLLLGTTSDLVLNPIIRPNLGYDPVKDFTPISIMAVSVAAIAVNASLPVTSLKELVAYAKANPGKLSYGSAGAGTMANLAGELFKELAGLPEIVHIPYKGAAPGIADLVAGHIPMMAANVSDSAIALHRAGKIRLLAAASERRVTAAPEIPTSAEAGYPDFIAQLFMGVFTPARTPQPVVDRLAAVSKQVMADKDFQGKLIAQAFEPVQGSNPAAAKKYMAEEVARWTPVLKRAGMTTN